MGEDGVEKAKPRWWRPVAKGTKIWSAIRRALTKRQSVHEGDSEAMVEETEKPPIFEEIKASEKPLDWFYQHDRAERVSTEQKKEQLRMELKARDDEECTFRPQLSPGSKEMPVTPMGFLQRQSLLESVRRASIEKERKEKEWAEGEFVRRHEMVKAVYDPESVWQRSVEWNDQRTEKMVLRHIDTEIQGLAECTFEPVKRRKKGGGSGASQGGKTKTLREWKADVTDDNRSKIFRELSEQIRTFVEDKH